MYNPDQPPKKIGKPTHKGTRNKGNKIKHINILTINVRGIKSKMDSLETTLHTQITHIAGITETHLTSGESINIPGYEWKGKERKKKEGGGIGFLIRTDIANMIEDIDGQNDQAETKWIKLKKKKKKKNNMHSSHIRNARKCTDRKSRKPIQRTNNRHKQTPTKE